MARQLRALGSRGPEYCSPHASYTHTSVCRHSFLKYHQTLFEIGFLAGLELDMETRPTCLTWAVTHLLVLFLMMAFAAGPGL